MYVVLYKTNIKNVMVYISGGSWWNWREGCEISSLVEHMGLSPWLFL